MTRTSTARSNPASRAAAARLRLLALCGVTALAPAAGTVAPPRQVGPAVREGMPPGARPTDARLTTAPF
jgi:hypothetical protein